MPTPRRAWASCLPCRLGATCAFCPTLPAPSPWTWFLDRFGPPRGPDGRRDFAALERRAGAVPRGAGGVVLLPYVNGSGVLALPAALNVICLLPPLVINQDQIDQVVAALGKVLSHEL